MAVPYTFANATVSIPLSELDSNFATTITLGNTAIELGNTVTTLNNMTLANVTVSSGNATFTTANVTNMSSSNVTITGGTIANVTISGSGSNITATNINASNVTVSADLTLSGGTANGVAYLNGSKVLTTGSALTFDGTNLGVGTSTAGNAGTVNVSIGAPGTTAGGLQLWTSTTGSSYLQWGTAASGTSYYRGYLQYNYNSGSDYLAFGISAAEQMRLTSTGLGIGTSSPGQKLEVAGNVLASNNQYIGIKDTTGAAVGFPIYTGSNDAIFGYLASGSTGISTYQFRTGNNVERMRIDSSGNVGIGTSSPSSFGQLAVNTTTVQRAGWFYVGAASSLSTPAASFVKYDNDTTTSQVLVNFLVNGSLSGQGQINANGANAAAFGTYSDKRLKDNIVDLPPQLENICALRPVEFDYIESEGGGHQIGFIAQEMQQIYPDAIGKRADEMLTVSGFGKTEARLIKAIQELKAELDATKAEVAALKGV